MTPAKTAPSGTLRRPRAPGREAPSETALAERALLTMLARGLIPASFVEASDFSEPAHAPLAQWLIEGKAASAYIESITDEQQRGSTLRALNYAPVPDAREDAIKMAEECLQTIRKSRGSRRIEQLQSEIGGATPEQKKALYAQMTAMLKEEVD